MEFTPFPKIARWNRDTIITEKLDGTNAQIFIQAYEGVEIYPAYEAPVCWRNHEGVLYRIFAGSRNRWLQPGKKTDNFGFAQWVVDNADDLVKLGPGRHFGEWWGYGIQRGYGLACKRFSLFNVVRYQGNPDLPKCCHVVPLLWSGNSMPYTFAIDEWIDELRAYGSRAADFDRPEGIVIHHTQSRQSFKVTLENDEGGKGK